MSTLQSWRDVLPPPEPPDLLAESRDRQETGEAAAAGLCRSYLVGIGKPAEGGIDLIVFGPYRKACKEDADYTYTLPAAEETSERA